MLINKSHASILYVSRPCYVFLACILLQVVLSKLSLLLLFLHAAAPIPVTAKLTFRPRMRCIAATLDSHDHIMNPDICSYDIHAVVAPVVVTDRVRLWKQVPIAADPGRSDAIRLDQWYWWIMAEARDGLCVSTESKGCFS